MWDIARGGGLVVLVGAGLSSCTPSVGPKQRPPPLVTTMVVAAEDVPVIVRAPVDVRPLAQADIGSKSVGLLDSVLVDRGDVVKKGQLLALVRPSDLPDQLAAAKNAVSQSEAARQLAKSNLERAQALAPRGLVSQQDLQMAVASMASAEAQAGAAQAQLAALATRLGETRLDAPFDGVVMARRLDPGSLVGPTSGAVVTVARIDIVRVFVAVPEYKASLLAVGQRAFVKLDALAGELVEGSVERLAPAYDAVTMHNRFPVGLSLLRLSVFVFVVTGDAVARRRVELGEDLGSRLEIKEGLEAGEEIVVRGIDALSNGAKIRKSPRADGGVTAPQRL